MVHYILKMSGFCRIVKLTIFEIVFLSFEVDGFAPGPISQTIERTLQFI